MKSKRRGETATDHRFYPLSNARKKNPKKLTKHRPRAPSAVSLELRGLLLLLLLLIGPNTTLQEACGALGDVGRGRARVGVVVVFRGGGGLGEEKKKIERRRV